MTSLRGGPVLNVPAFPIDSGTSAGSEFGDVEEFPVAQILPLLNAYVERLPVRERALFSTVSLH